MNKAAVDCHRQIIWIIWIVYVFLSYLIGIILYVPIKWTSTPNTDTSLPLHLHDMI